MAVAYLSAWIVALWLVLAGKSVGISVRMDCCTVVGVSGEVYWHIYPRGLSHCGWCLAGKSIGIIYLSAWIIALWLVFSREVYWHICLRGLLHCDWCLEGKSTGISVCVDYRTVVDV